MQIGGVEISAAWISALAALVAVIIAPTIQYFIAKIQLKGNIIASNRVKWIENLRNDLSEMIALQIRIIRIKSQIKILQEAYQADKPEATKKINYDQYAKAVEISGDAILKSNLLIASLRMRLKTNEPEQKKIRDLVDRLQKSGAKMNRDDLEKICIELEEAARQFFEQEWRKVKKFQ